MKNEKLLNMFRTIYIPTTISGDHISSACVSALGMMAKSYGFVFGKKTLAKLAKMSKEELTTIYRQASDIFEKASGKAYEGDRCFYPSFPVVPDLATQAVDAFVHYLTVALNDIGFNVSAYLPEGAADMTYEQYARNYIIVDIATSSDELEAIYRNYLNTVFASKALTEREDNVREVYKELTSTTKYIPKEIKFKELLKVFYNIAGLTAALEYTKTVNDVKRLVDVLGRIDRATRREILGRLDEICYNNKENVLDDMNPNREEWIKIFEKLHPGDYANRFTNIYSIVKDLRSGDYSTFMGTVNALLASDKTVIAGAKMLSKKPGIFLRYLDRIVRLCAKSGTCKEIEELLPMIRTAVSKASIPVAISLYNYYSLRDQASDKRVFVIKGNKVDKIHIENNDTRVTYTRLVINRIHTAIREGIKSKFGGKDIPLSLADKKVYIDASLSKYSVPETNRNSSDSLTRMPFGTCLDFEPSEVIRFFTHWKNISNKSIGRVDIDLSCHVFDDDGNYKGEYSWRRRDNTNLGITFSGDITSAPNGAFEYMDVDTTKSNFNWRYVVMCNNVYTGQPFNMIPECFSGIMLRKADGIAFNDSSVTYKFDLNQESTATNVAVLVDIRDHKLYYIDRQLFEGPVAGDYKSAIEGIIRKVLAERMNQYDLFYDALTAMGTTIVNDRKEADYVISDDEEADLHPWDQATIALNFLSL